MWVDPRRDRHLQVALLAGFGVALAYLAPPLTASRLPGLSYLRGIVILLPVCMWVVKNRRDAVAEPLERHFWRYLLTGLATSGLLHISLDLLPVHRLPWRHLLIDIVFLFAYAAFMLAAQTHPDRGAPPRSRDPQFRLNLAGLLLFSFGLLAYIGSCWYSSLSSCPAFTSSSTPSNGSTPSSSVSAMSWSWSISCSPASWLRLNSVSMKPGKRRCGPSADARKKR